MPEPGAIHIIRSLQKKWMVNTLLSYLLVSLAVTLLTMTVLARFLQLPGWWSIPILMVSFAVFFFLHNSWKVSERNIALFLNQQFAQLEESCGLLLQPYESLNLLEKLQVHKVEQTLPGLPAPAAFYKKLRQSALLLLAAGAASAALMFFPATNHETPGSGYTANKASGSKPEKILPGIASVQVTINPPAYTGKAARTQSLFNIRAEQGAGIRWQVTTTVPAEGMQLLISGQAPVSLRALNDKHTVWGIEKNMQSPGFYQVKTAGKLSELYTIDLIRDAPPVVVIQKPGSYTIIDYGQPQQLAMQVSIEDDYGVREASIFATTTTGTGEGVKFKEQQLAFAGFAGGGRQYRLQKTLDLPALGMKPGDELYFYVRSLDNHNQETRSDVYMVSIPDTAQLMSIDGLASGANVKPEYFRSQRQIIIETEQLLADRKTISVEEFNTKSNNLGIDQKMLRLRYGKFLGEESEGESEEGHAGHHDHDQEGGNPAADFGNAQKMMDEVSHKHDVAEDASFFDPESKKQLKATLAEMWNAELRLRTFKPQEALPYEYKALRLLKDLQEKGRSYVAKTSTKTTPLKPEKRLTGDLSLIEQPVTRADFVQKENPLDAIRRALGTLESLKEGTGPDRTALATLQQAAGQLNRSASAQPTVYLTAVGAMNRVLQAAGNATPVSASDITAAQKGLKRLVSPPAALPGPDEKAPDQNLSRQYFKNLKQLNR